MLAALALAAGDVQPVAQAFGAREAVSQISLSPDGTHIAVIAPHGRGEVLEIGDLTGGGALTAVLSSSGDPDHLQRCDWTTPTRLVCAILLSENAGLSQRLGYTRLIALDSSGGNVKVLAAQAEGALGFAQRGGAIIDLAADDHGGVLIMRDFVPEQSTGTLLAAAGRGLGVERVDTRTLARSIVEQPRSGAATYISDGHGTERLMAVRATTGTGLDRDTVSWFYRKPDDHGWQPLSRVVGGAGFQPYAVEIATATSPTASTARMDGRRCSG